MFIKQSNDTFIRKYNNIGYIYNQRTKHDRIYDETGSIFLSKLTRTPKNFNEITEELQSIFTSANRAEIENDLKDFILELEKDKFVIVGESKNDVESKDYLFSYSFEDPKKSTYSFLNPEKYQTILSTTDFFDNYLRNNPQIIDMEMELTSRCNERCLHCYIPHENKLNDIDAQLAMDILCQMKELGGINISLSGGEPFLHENFISILQSARKNDLSISILSNAVLLSNEIMSCIKDANISQIQISLYSMNQKEHDKITQLQGSWKKTIDNIERLISENIPVQISCPVMKINQFSYIDVLKWGYDKKIKVNTDFIMMGRTDFSTDNLKFRLNSIETTQLIKDIIRNDKEYIEQLDIEPKSNKFDDYKNKPVCGVGISNICMVSNGNFYPCSGWQSYILGNAYKNSLKEVWENSENIKFLRSITNSSFPQCLSCEARDYCSMFMVINFNESNGDMFKVNKNFCEVAFITKKEVENYKSKRK